MIIIFVVEFLILIPIIFLFVYMSIINPDLKLKRVRFQSQHYYYYLQRIICGIAALFFILMLIIVLVIAEIGG